MAREYTAEELGLGAASAQKEYTADELGLPPGQREFTADELGIPKAAPAQEDKTSNPFKGLAARAANLAGEGVEGVARAAESIGDKLELAMPLTNLTPEQVKAEQQLQPLFDFSKNLKDWGKDIGYTPSTQLGELPGNPLKAVPFIAERIIASSPDMVAAVGVAPAYIVSRTNEILNDRLTNDKKPWEEATVGDVSAAAGAAVLETFLERFATKHLLPGGGTFTGSTAKKIGKETALQSGTEGIEEGIGYLGGAAGTEAGVDPYQMAQQMIEGAIVGGGLGAGVQGVKEYATKAEEKKADKEFRDTVTEDFEAKFEETKGRAPTEEETKIFVDAVEQAREEQKAEETKSEDTGVDTGITEPSVPVSGEPSGGTDRTAVEVEDAAARSMVGDNGPTGIPTDREAPEPSALDPEVKARASTYLDSVDSKTLIPTARTVNSIARDLGLEVKKGAKMADTITAIRSVIAPTVEAQAVEAAPVEKTATDLYQEIKTIEDQANALRTPNGWPPRNKEKLAQFETLMDQRESLMPAWANADTREKQAAKQATEVAPAVNEAELTGAPEAVKQELADAPEEVKQEVIAPEITKTETTPAAKPMSFNEFLGSKGLTTDSLRGLSDEQNTALRQEMDAYYDQFPESKEIIWSFPSVEKQEAQGDVVTPPAPKKAAKNKTKAKKAIDEFIDEFEDNPDSLSRYDLDNLLADPAATKAENTSPKANKVSVDDPLFKAAHPTVIRAISNNDITGVIKGLKENAGTFISSFADRILGLGLTTQIGWDDVHVDLAMKSLAKVDGQKNRIIMWVKQIYPEVYRNKFDESKMQTPVTQLLASFQELQDGKLGIPPKMFETDLKDVIKQYESTLVTLNAPGTYFTDYNAIGLSLENRGGSNYVVVHELTHAATHWAINNVDKLNNAQLEALGKLEGLYEFAKLHTKNQSQYGYNNIHEFVAEAFSNPIFQKELRSMKAGMHTNMSAWSKFIQLVARLFGSDNVLFHTLSNADVLFSARSGSEASGGADILWAPSRYDVKDGKFALNPGERMGFINKLIKNRTNWKDVNKDSVKKFFGSLNNQYRRYLLGALTIDQMADIYGADMPQLKLYAKEVDAMIATRNAILTEGDPIITTWSNLLKDNPAKAKQLGQAMIEATIKKNDPDPKGIGHDAKAYATDASLKKAWTELTTGKDSDTAVKIYREVRDFYDRRMQEYVKVQTSRIEEYGQIKGLTKEEIAAKQVAFKRDTEEKIIRPYFPIKRFGDYFLMVGKGQKKIFMQFEDAFARDAEMEKQKAKLIDSGLSDADAQGMLWPGQGFNEVLNEKLNDVTQLSKINQMIDESTDAILKSKDPKIANAQVASLQAELKDQFGQYYLELLPSESIKKMFLHRDNVAGPSQDMLRAFGMSRERIAYQRARFQHMPELFNIVEAAKIRSKSMPTTDEKSVYGDVANELAKNFKGAVLEPPKQSRLTTYLTHFGFLNFLTAPASAVVNMMAIPAIYTPVAGAKYGYKNVSKALAKYTRMLGGTGYQNENNGRVEFLSLARAKLADVPLLDKAGKPVFRTDADGNKIPVNMADVYQHGVNRNVIDTTLTHDSVSIGEHPSSDYTGRWQKFMYYASLPFHAAEKFNREVTFMSSFDLAYDKLIAKGYTGEKAYTEALDAARDLTQETMFNYNTTNKPRYFRGDLINVLLQFKMYPQHMSVLLGRTFYKSINQNEKHELDLIKEDLKTAPPEVLAKALEEKKAELADLKRESTKAFWGMMGMSFLSAGMTGMPLWFVFSGVMSAFHAAFGDDDEPLDVENWFKNWAGRTFGGFLGDTISRGLLSQATGLNFADRMNMNLTDMWFPDVRKSQDEVDYMQNMFINLMGPSAGAILVNYPEALKRFNDGHIERAVEGMMPAAIKNAMVGTRYLVQGEALTLKGNTLVDDVSAREAFAQMLGFSPERVAQKQKAAIEAKNMNETIKNRRTDLLNAFFIATDSSDEDMLDRVIDKMGTFSQTYPELAINGETLLASVTKRYQDRALANITGGMGLDKKLIPRLEGMLDYGED